MKIRTIFGSCLGIAIALMIGAVLLDRLEQVYLTESPHSTSFLALLAAVGAFTGGAIASPPPGITEK